ncbi:general substrate transporter [Aureobasidium sp. EXF-10727]|nr:general substrate transporter [Aureobasidium sp. EXF-10727]
MKNTGTSPELAAVLPRDGRAWYTKPHLLKIHRESGLTISASANGYDGSLMNGLQALPQWNHLMDTPTGAWLGFINAIYWVAVGIVSPIAGWASTRWGRKRPLYAAYCFLITATILQTASPNPATFIVSRVLLGPATAIFGNSAPLLITEIAYPTHRGVATALFFCGFYVGAIIAAWIVFGVRNYADSWAWRLPSLFQALCPLTALPGLIMCNESPRWLVSVGRQEEAHQSLADMHAGGDMSSPLVQLEIREIEATLTAERDAHNAASYREMLSTKGNRWRLFVTITLGFFTQWVGNGVVSYYLALVLDTVGIKSTTDQTLISGCLQIWNLLWSVAAATMVDKLGRRKLFMASFVVMLVSYVVITGLSASFAKTDTAGIGTAVIPFLFIYFAGYDIALTPLLIAYPTEIWPYRLRGRGLSLVWVSLVIGVVFNTFVNPIALSAIGWKYYIVFVAVILMYGITAYLCYPETRGHSLEQMTIIFDGNEAMHYHDGVNLGDDHGIDKANIAVKMDAV